jgi:uncharacterized DUF497 family protein
MNRNEEFEWDTDKDLLNQAKHGVSFQEARQAFEDPNRGLREIRHTALKLRNGSIVSVSLSKAF